MPSLSVVRTITDSRGDLVAGGSYTVTPAGSSATKRDSRIISVTSGAEVTFTIDTNVSGGDVGECNITNLDPTNYVRLAFATTAYYIRIGPGRHQSFTLEPALTALYLRADTADCDVSISVWPA